MDKVYVIGTVDEDGDASIRDKTYSKLADAEKAAAVMVIGRADDETAVVFQALETVEPDALPSKITPIV